MGCFLGCVIVDGGRGGCGGGEERDAWGVLGREFGGRGRGGTADGIVGG